jgi:hypothetical protein
MRKNKLPLVTGGQLVDLLNCAFSDGGFTRVSSDDRDFIRDGVFFALAEALPGGELIHSALPRSYEEMSKRVLEADKEGRKANDGDADLTLAEQVKVTQLTRMAEYFADRLAECKSEITSAKAKKAAS